MLQKLRDSSNVRKYSKYIYELENYSRSLLQSFSSAVNVRASRVFICYQGLGYLPASIMYWFAATMNRDASVFFSEVNTIVYYVLPYVEGGFAILYTTEPQSPATIRFLQANALLNNEHVLVSTKPRDERVLSALSGYKVLYVNGEDELESSLAMAILTYYSAASAYRDRAGSRGARIYSHALEGLHAIVEELVNKYVDSLEIAVQRESLTLTSTKILEPAVQFLVAVLNRIGIPSRFEPLEQIVSGDNVLVVSTSVEELAVKEYKHRRCAASSVVESIVLNTDPLEAQIYIAVLSYYLLYTFREDLGGAR